MPSGEFWSFIETARYTYRGKRHFVSWLNAGSVLGTWYDADARLHDSRPALAAAARAPVSPAVVGSALAELLAPRGAEGERGVAAGCMAPTGSTPKLRNKRVAMDACATHTHTYEKS